MTSTPTSSPSVDPDANNNGIDDALDLQVLFNKGFPGDDNDDASNFANGHCFNKGFCIVDQNCSQTFDCANPDRIKCVKDISVFEDITECFDTAEAQHWILITQIAVPAAAILLALHVLLSCYLQFKAQLSAVRRASQKRRKKESFVDGEDLVLESMRFGNFADYKSSVFIELYDSEDEDGQTVQRTLARNKSEVLREAETQLERYRDTLEELLRASHDEVSKVREEAGIVKMNSKIMAPLRLQVATQFRILTLMLLRKKTFVGWKDDEIMDAINRLQLVKACLSRSRKEAVAEAEKILADALKETAKVDKKLTQKLKDKSFKNWDLNWDINNPKLQILQAQVYIQLRPDDPYYQRVAEMAGTNFTEQKHVVQEAAKKHGTGRNPLRRLFKCLAPNFFYHYPLFYSIYYGIQAVIIVSFVGKVGNYENNLELQNGGLFGTFLPVPGYYDLQNNELDNYYVPLIYGIMHCALFNLCLIPVPMTRGLLRNLSLWYPQLRKHCPIDDAYWFHKFVAVHLLGALLAGAFIFAFHIGQNCLDTSAITGQACFAYDPQPPAILVANNFAINPVQNVYMLRKIVWMTWFTVFPMMHWANNIPSCAPSFLKRYWYEIWFYAHHAIAHTSIFLALIARFEVFYINLVTWGIYYLDKIRESVMKTAKSEIIIRPVHFELDINPDDAKSSTVHLDDKDQPNSMRILIEVPPGFKVNAGQWIYLKVPSISRIQWHPFSLASASRDSFVELHIGIRGNKSQWKKRQGPDPWIMVRNPTWTYKLYRALRQRIHDMASLEDPERQAERVNPLFCYIRGPYGSTFTKCFDPHYYGSIIIGAGTGLTAAESVLRELLWRKRQQLRVPKYTWFVWSCRRVDDLLWAWSSLHELITSAIKRETLRPGKRWNSESLMLDWLGVYLYISRADKKQLDKFKETISMTETEHLGGAPSIREKLEEKEDDEEGEVSAVDVDTRDEESLSVAVHKWMSHPNRLFTQSLDDRRAHIEKLFAWTRLFVDRKAGRHKKIALCFCGPGGVAHVLSRAAAKTGGGEGMQFSADSQ